MPCHFSLEADWLHPATGKPALSLYYDADRMEANHSLFVEAAYPQEDFFSLNEGSIAEYRERYLPTLTLALIPVALEMPADAWEDILTFAMNTGIWESVGMPEILESPVVMKAFEILGMTTLLQALEADSAED
jgi:hypothetical protein